MYCIAFQDPNLEFKKNFEKLNKLVLVKFLQDQVVIPKESEVCLIFFELICRYYTVYSTSNIFQICVNFLFSGLGTTKKTRRVSYTRCEKVHFISRFGNSLSSQTGTNNVHYCSICCSLRSLSAGSDRPANAGRARRYRVREL